MMRPFLAIFMMLHGLAHLVGFAGSWQLGEPGKITYKTTGKSPEDLITDFRNSYMFSGEYEIFEWNLGRTYNYAEMAALIAPRPFMVERGHNDGVGIDEWVAWEFAKVKRHYDYMGIGDKTEIEWFNGPHTIHGVGTYEFLRKHLNWQTPKPSTASQ